jgi:folate-binding protein YgfZ
MWCELPPRSCLVARGVDAATFIDHFTTAASGRLEPGTGCEGFFTDARGSVLALATLLRTTTGMWIDAAAGIAAPLRDHLEHYHIREAVELVDASDERASFLVTGSEADEWLAAQGQLSLPRQVGAHGEARLGGVAAAVARLAWCGPDGLLVQVARADAARLADWLAAGGLARIATETVTATRIEAGWPDPEDITAKTLPQELARDTTAISFAKGCYLGQETVARIDALGHVNRRLVGLATALPVAVGAEVRCDGAPVARVTSACRSARLGAGLALAIVPLKALADGAALDVDGAAARVVPLPVPPPDDAAEVLFTARRFHVVRLPQPCNDGTVATREVVVHPGSVVVVPLVRADLVCLVEVARVAVGATLLELPAGTLDRDEPLAAAAARELAEETGYRAGTIEASGSFWMSPGILRERMHLFVARDLVAGPQALEPGEQIRTREVGWDEAVAMCLDGRIEDAKTIAGILLLAARRRSAGG